MRFPALGSFPLRYLFLRLPLFFICGIWLKKSSKRTLFLVIFFLNSGIFLASSSFKPALGPFHQWHTLPFPKDSSRAYGKDTKTSNGIQSFSVPINLMGLLTTDLMEIVSAPPRVSPSISSVINHQVKYISFKRFGRINGIWPVIRSTKNSVFLRLYRLAMLAISFIIVLIPLQTTLRTYITTLKPLPWHVNTALIWILVIFIASIWETHSTSDLLPPMKLIYAAAL